MMLLKYRKLYLMAAILIQLLFYLRLPQDLLTLAMLLGAMLVVPRFWFNI
jgi:hypothetical protein